MESDTIYINSRDTPESATQNNNKSAQQIIYGKTGLSNSTMTHCYMNSAIQILSHNYPLTNYLFMNKDKIIAILKINAGKNLRDNSNFKLDSNNLISAQLKQKIHDPEYNPSMLTAEEEIVVLNNMITIQLIKLLEKMWERNQSINPISFRAVFSEARDRFFYGLDQHDAEEAYSCIIQKMQEELAEEKNIKFKTDKPSVQEFLAFRNKIMDEINATDSIERKRLLFEHFTNKKKEFPVENLIVEGYKEMKKFYGSSYSRITEIFTGFLHSSITCPNANCKYSSNKFDPYFHLSLPMPTRNANDLPLTILAIEDCMKEYCRVEILDEKNLWKCEQCHRDVRAIKTLRLWTAPPVLVIQLKRFGVSKLHKDSRLVNFPLDNLDIKPIISQIQQNSAKCYTYRLQSVVNHHGGLGSGHYYTYCLDEDSGIWYEFNDMFVRRAQRIITSEAYLLVYTRKDMIVTIKN